MSEHTKDLEIKYVSGVCIGIGTKGIYSKITANSILPETDEDYEKEKHEIIANMKLYAAAPDLLRALQMCKEYVKDRPIVRIAVNNAIKKATNGL